MAARNPHGKFQVAFSLAGEQRDLVRPIAEMVEKELGSPNVFFDEWFEHYLAGDDADLKLQEIYGNRCALVVICISKNYGGKPWTLAEHAAIRARFMKTRASKDRREQMSLLPIRVGDGEVDGILFNTIAPDVRDRTPAKSAELIIERLRLVLGDDAIAVASSVSWPEKRPLTWAMADHTEVGAAFERLLTDGPPSRFLAIFGPSEVGKSHITKQMYGHGLQVPGLACGRFDFKGTTDMDDEVRAFVQDLEVPLPPVGHRLNERLGQILDALKQRAGPTLLVFDTYESAGETKDWVEKQLLPSLIRASWLRVVIAGQRVPKRTAALSSIGSVMTLKPPPPPDWFEYGKQHRPDLTLGFVEAACKLAKDKASLLDQLLGPTT